MKKQAIYKTSRKFYSPGPNYWNSSLHLTLGHASVSTTNREELERIFLCDWWLITKEPTDEVPISSQVQKSLCSQYTDVHKCYNIPDKTSFQSQDFTMENTRSPPSYLKLYLLAEYSLLHHHDQSSYLFISFLFFSLMWALKTEVCRDVTPPPALPKTSSCWPVQLKKWKLLWAGLSWYSPRCPQLRIGEATWLNGITDRPTVFFTPHSWD